MKRTIFMLITVIMVCFSMIYTAQAAAPNDNPFPIGICEFPNAGHTTFEAYKEIKDMNVTYMLAGEGIDDFSTNDAALTQCAANGLKAIVHDTRMMWYRMPIEQTNGSSGIYVSSSNSLGQTFTIPSNNTAFAIDTIQLSVDKLYWTAGITLTLSVYDSPSKTNLLKSSSITGPVSDNYPIFNIGLYFNSGLTYYMELTSNSITNVGLVGCSTSDVYSGGTAYQNGVANSTYDFWFKMDCGKPMYTDASQPYTQDIDDVANHYKTNSAVHGYLVQDEPGVNIMTRVQSTVERFRQDDPNQSTHVNLLPSYASDFGFGQATGEYVTPSTPLGQTFKTNSKTTFISTIELYICSAQWSTSEPLTLKLWNSTDKTTLLGQCTLNGSSTDFPLFTLNVNVSANTSYYWELIHGGGGDNSVGWVVRSSNGIDWERDGTAYVAGTQINADFWFTINQNIIPFTYEDYVYRWVSKNPDYIMYDHYPFYENNGFSSSYYSDLEIIRRQALKGSVDFWTFIQSLGITGWLRVPSESEMRYQIYTSLAYGAKGICYFCYETPNWTGYHDAIMLPDYTKNTSYTWAQNINAGVLKLGPTLKTLISQEVYHTGTTLPDSTTALPSDFFWKPTDSTQPLVIGYFKNSIGRKYIMVVNRDYTNSRTVSFTLSPKPGTVTEVSKTTGLEVSTDYNYISGTLSSTFAPGEGRLYAISTDVHVGLDTVGSNTDNPSDNTFIATKATANQNETVDRLNLYIDSNAVGTARLGIYTDNNGSPGTLLAQTGDITLVNGWNTGDITSTNLTSGTDYWLVVNFNQQGSHPRYNASGTIKFRQNYTYGALPSTAPDMTNIITATYSFYASGMTTDVGLDTVGSNTDNPSDNTFIATKATANQNETVDWLNLYIDSNAVGTARLGIYTDNNGSPGTLLAQTGDITLVNGWNTGDITSTNLTLGTDYWLVVNFSQQGSHPRYNASGTIKFRQNYTYGALPSTAPDMTNIITATYSFYASP
jgi:hypothetical protein